MRLTRLIGPARAKELLFTGATVADDQALQWGLVNRLVADGSALDAARELAATIAARGPVSNRLAKELVEAAQDLSIDAALSLSTVSQQKIFDSEDLHEGVAAFSRYTTDDSAALMPLPSRLPNSSCSLGGKRE